uniref:Tail tape measure protein n=1 Tax=Myoviridae sp. ct2Pw37 TaxID=2825021 RepID=A0A8S5P9X1_9CAUD|nr:MAG TPA: tail tape measure protein [Myoviridae sp. ct2Pw37]
MLGKSFGGSVKLSGESEYRKALRDITSSLKEVSSELKLTNIQFTNGEKTVKETKTSYDSANNTIKEQREKVNELRETLKQAEKQYGSNNEKVKLFKTQLNNAESQLASMEEQTDKSTKEIKEMKKGFDDAGSGALKFGDILKANVLSEAIVSGIKKLGSVVKEVGSAFIKIGKQALDSYADYEQLVGGVETLFKDNASTVENYANNAYKTAGLSANEYMETVTAFSASLLQSLNGDTAKSAEVADIAITDMADNANKMGTSMDMIQNAYQGFAKQNYTMLDNLKLGYGGTKTEMERLLADAQKISGVKYDISNLNDVYQAIHVIQGELGITGTTAKEASTTIQGSVSAMKSAWQNMLTGIADDNADFDGLINNLVDSIGTAAENIMPRVQIIIDGVIALVGQLGEKIVEHLPEILETCSNIFTQIIDSIGTFAPQIGVAAFQIVNALITGIASNLPAILEAGIELLVELITGISQTLPQLIPVMVDAILTMAETLIDNIDTIIEAGIELIIALAEGLIEALPKLIEKIPTIIEKLVTKLTNPEMIGKIIQAAARLIVELGIGLIKAIPQLLSKIPQIISTIVKGLMNGVRSLKDVGKNLLKGLWEGMSGLGTWLWNKVKGMLNGLTDKIKNFFGIHSPSTLFKDEIGENLALGLGEGFTDTMKNVTTDMQNAIPTEFDTSMEINSTKNIETNQNNNSYLVQALKEALKEMKVELNDREVGNFVDSKLTEAVY